VPEGPVRAHLTLATIQAIMLHVGEEEISLLRYPLQRGVIVESEITRVDDIVSLCVVRELVELPEAP